MLDDLFPLRTHGFIQNPCIDEEVGRPSSRDMVVQAGRKVERGSAGLPVGVQVVARPWREHVALAVMRAIEDAVCMRDDYPVVAEVTK